MDEDTRKRILQAARHQFFSLGYSKVTVDDLAYELGMSKRTLYQYFPSKKQLLRHAWLDLFHSVAEGLEEIVKNPRLDSLEKFYQVLSFIAHKLPHFSPVFVKDIQRTAPELFEEIDQLRLQLIQRQFSKLFRHGIKQGYFRPDLDQALLLLMFSTLVQRIISPETLSHLPLSARQAFEQITSLVVQGILTEKGRKKHQAAGKRGIQEEPLA